MDDKLKSASKNYQCGCTCSQAVFCAYAEEMGIDEHTAYKLMEGFGGGCGGMQEVCGALSAAIAIISFYTSDGELEGGRTKGQTYQKVQEAAELFRREYGGVTCREVLHGESPKAMQCGMKVKCGYNDRRLQSGRRGYCRHRCDRLYLRAVNGFCFWTEQRLRHHRCASVWGARS